VSNPGSAGSASDDSPPGAWRHGHQLAASPAYAGRDLATNTQEALAAIWKIVPHLL